MPLDPNSFKPRREGTFKEAAVIFYRRGGYGHLVGISLACFVVGKGFSNLIESYTPIRSPLKISSVAPAELKPLAYGADAGIEKAVDYYNASVLKSQHHAPMARLVHFMQSTDGQQK